MDTTKQFLVSGYWKSDKVKFSNHIIVEAEYSNDFTDEEDEEIFYYGMTEEDIKLNIRLQWASVEDFVIISYSVINN